MNIELSSEAEKTANNRVERGECGAISDLVNDAIDRLLKSQTMRIEPHKARAEKERS